MVVPLKDNLFVKIRFDTNLRVTGEFVQMLDAKCTSVHSLTRMKKMVTLVTGIKSRTPPKVKIKVKKKHVMQLYGILSPS